MRTRAVRNSLAALRQWGYLTNPHNRCGLSNNYVLALPEGGGSGALRSRRCGRD